MNAATFQDGDGKPIPAQSIGLHSYDKATGHLVLTYNNLQYRLLIREDTFDRMFSWITNKGTGLYSAWQVSDKEMKAGGMVRRDKGMIAEEFLGNKDCEQISHTLDFSNFIEPFHDKTRVLIEMNAGSTPRITGKSQTYIVSDIASDFTATLHNGTVALSGTLHRYHRHESTHVDGRAYLYDADQYTEYPEMMALQALRRFQKTRLIPPNARSLEALEKSVADHHAALHFARTVAVLRSLHKHNRKSWDHFMENYFEKTIPGD